MEDRALEAIRAQGLQAPNAHLPSPAAWQYEGSPQTPTPLGALLVGEMSRRPARHPGEPGQAHRRGGRGEIAPTFPAARTGPGAPPSPEGTADPPGLDSEARHRRTTAVGDS